jgi:hypothetical protein
MMSVLEMIVMRVSSGQMIPNRGSTKCSPPNLHTHHQFVSCWPKLLERSFKKAFYYILPVHPIEVIAGSLSNTAEKK